ncbi:MAG TPA: carboxypeptidase-like regulatory domain-containing protein [Acidisarcina sp.]
MRLRDFERMPASSLRCAMALCVALVFTLFASGSLPAQSIVSGDIAGTVTDVSGSAVSGATVVVTSKETGPITTIQTTDTGAYRVPLLKPGAYDISVSAPGFEKTTLSVGVTLGTVTSGDVKLTVGSASATVEVSAAPNTLHTDSADLSTVFTMQQVQDLPNPGNDLTFVAQTAPRNGDEHPGRLRQLLCLRPACYFKYLYRQRRIRERPVPERQQLRRHQPAAG